MALRELLRDKVPADLQLSPEYKALLSLLKKTNISDKATLRTYLSQECAACEAKLKDSRDNNMGGTKTRLVHALAKKYKFLQLVQDRLLSYLD